MSVRIDLAAREFGTAGSEVPVVASNTPSPGSPLSRSAPREIAVQSTVLNGTNAKSAASLTGRGVCATMPDVRRCRTTPPFRHWYFTKEGSDMSSAESKSPMEAIHIELRRNNLLLEKLGSEFAVFGDGLTSLTNKVDGLDSRVARFETKFDRLDLTLSHLESEFGPFKIALMETGQDVKELKKDMKDVQSRLSSAEAKLP